ncbi:MAG: hypothetical protein GXP27_05485 [Planctomycetes bacterium]|nr:hypothetical protein [Planctomycetota bacterium]
MKGMSECTSVAIWTGTMVVGIFCGTCGRASAQQSRPERSVPAVSPAGALIEAEQFTARQPNDGSFATVTHDPTASGGRAVARFFPREGQCLYEFAVSKASQYDIWLRYASNSQPQIRFSIDANAGARPQVARLRNTGKLSGRGAWQWTKLGSAKLARGRHRLVLFGCPIRTDCLWISIGQPPPTDQQLIEARLRQVREHLKNPIEPITPDWFAEADQYELPEWYDSIRVCAHTRLSWRWRTRKPGLFFGAGKLLASIGFKEIARHIKSGDEPAWWPSRVGAVLDQARATNFAKRIIDEAHAAGCRIIVYHRHMEDRFVAEQHPEWTARDWQGKVIEKRGPKICFNTPYADFVETRLVELTKMGADGFYFDEVHMPKPFCWCENCRRRFKAETGLDYPESPDPFDPAYQKAIEFKNVTIERLFRRWRRAIHAVNPETVLLIGSNTYPQMVDRHTTHRLYRIADSMKTEFSLPDRASANRVFSFDKSLEPTERDARLALGYAIARDACDGRPPHVWTHGLPNATHALFATAGVIAHGGIANLDHPEATIPDPELFQEAVALGNRIAPAFARMRPLRWAAVHYSEYARDHYLPDEPSAWRKALYPVYGAFTTLLRARVPVGIVTDSQLEQGRLEATRLLFIPSREHLTERMRSAIARFERAGGQVIYQRADWRWYEPDGGMARAGEAFLREAAEAIRKAPISVHGGPKKMHAVCFTNRDRSRMTVALVNDFSWVFTGNTRTRDGRPIPDIEKKLNRRPPPPCRDVRIFLRTDRKPKEVRELAGGRSFEPVRTDAGYRIDVPTFDCTAVVHVRF